MPITKLRQLKKLYLTSRKLKSLDGISRLRELEELDLYNCTELTSMEGIELCPKLTTIEIQACNRLDAAADVKVNDVPARP
jgi:Leucine-rich repeat (LRR) protein